MQCKFCKTENVDDSVYCNKNPRIIHTWIFYAEIQLNARLASSPRPLRCATLSLRSR